MTGLTLGSQHACGYLSWATLAYCWGQNNYGQAGVDAASMQWWAYPNTTIVQFAASNGLGSAVARISAGGNFTCGEQLAGTVQCFGYNFDGELGNGQSGWGLFTTVPQTVGNGQALRGVSVGERHACALDGNGQAWCWGWGLYGQLGQGSSVNVAATPQQVTGGHAFRAIAAGYRHTCAIGTDNHIYCWGQNNYRQLGTYIFANGQVVTNGYSPNPVQADDPK
jgi:alpha-tubulin suppressor-like RCC1 family protein